MNALRRLSGLGVALTSFALFFCSGWAAALQLVAPKAAAVNGERDIQLHNGQSFEFSVRLDPVPEEYTGGTIECKFQDIRPEPYYGPELSVSAVVPLRDGQDTYQMTLPISGQMAAGTWELTEVKAGQGVKSILPISGKASFEIPPPPPAVIHIKGPTNVTAGQHVSFTIYLDKYPDWIFPSFCDLTLSTSLSPVGASDQLAPGISPIPIRQLKLTPGQQSYDLPVDLAPDLPGGPWVLSSSLLGTISPLRQPRYIGPVDICPPPPLAGDKEFLLSLAPAKGLVTPRFAAVTVTPPQVALLRAAADRLRTKKSQLANQLEEGSATERQALLQTSVQQLLADLERTKGEFEANETPPEFVLEINSFFDDLRFDYTHALQQLKPESARFGADGPRFELANAGAVPSSSHRGSAQQQVLAAISRNAQAYDVVADNASLTFSLEVSSVPQGAAISYKLRGDTYQAVGHETTWTLKNLPRAVYMIKLHLAGYEDKEVTFDAVDDPSTSIEPTLKRLGKSR
jgi:hypothetical protein